MTWGSRWVVAVGIALVGAGCGADNPGGGSVADAGSAGEADGSGAGAGGGTGGVDEGEAAGRDSGGASGQGDGQAGDSGGGDAGNGGEVGAEVETCRDLEDYAGQLPQHKPPDLPCGALGDLDVEEGVILDVGHARKILQLVASEDRLASRDDQAWILWDSSDHRMLARGPIEDCVRTSDGQCDVPCAVQLAIAGTTLAVGMCSGVELRSVTSGELMATATLATELFSWGLAEDGSYVWRGLAQQIDAIDATGTVLVSATGSYAFVESTDVFAAPDELRIAGGPRGEQVIETISMVTGESSSSAAFLGQFRAWFDDGTRFLTQQGTTLRIYSSATVTEELSYELPSDNEEVGGHGEYFWTFGAATRDWEIRSLVDASVPLYQRQFGIKQHDYPRRAGHTFAVVGGAELEVIELLDSGIELTSLQHPTSNQAVYAVDADGDWFVGEASGVVVSGADPEQPLSCGRILDIAGSELGMTAIATPGALLLFELTRDSRAYLGSLPVSSHFMPLAMDVSRDGTILAAAGHLPTPDYKSCVSIDPPSEVAGLDSSLRVWSLPDRTQLEAWPYVSGELPTLKDFSLSANGAHWGRVLEHDGQPYTKEVVDLAGNVMLSLSSANPEPPRLSPDGSHAAVVVVEGALDACVTTFATEIYAGATLVTTVPGYPVVWLDDSRLLVSASYGVDSIIYDTQGEAQPGPSLPSFYDSSVYWGRDQVRPLSPTEIFAEGFGRGRLVSLVTGKPLWTCDRGFSTPTASDYVLRHSSQSQVVLERY